MSLYDKIMRIRKILDSGDWQSFDKIPDMDKNTANAWSHVTNAELKRMWKCNSCTYFEQKNITGWGYCKLHLEDSAIYKTCENWRSHEHTYGMLKVFP